MTRIYLADAKPEERSLFHRILPDLEMVIVGEAVDWPTVLIQAPASQSDVLLVEWSLLPGMPGKAIEELRKACPIALVVVVSVQEAHRSAALSAGADEFISLAATAEHVAERLRAVCARN